MKHFDQHNFLTKIKKDYKYLKKFRYDVVNNRNLMLKTIKANPNCFIYLSNKLKNDKEFILNIVQYKNCWNKIYLSMFPEKIQNDCDVIFALCELHEINILHIPYKHPFRKNIEICIPLNKNDKILNINTHRRVFSYEYNKTFILNIMEKNIKVLKYINNNVLYDKDIFLKAIKLDKKNYYYFPLLNDKIYKKKKKILVENMKFNDLHLINLSSNHFLDRNMKVLIFRIKKSSVKKIFYNLNSTILNQIL